MEIVAAVIAIIFVSSCIAVVVFVIREIIKARKSAGRRESLGVQRIADLPGTLPQQDLANLIAYQQAAVQQARRNFTFKNCIFGTSPTIGCVSKKKWVTPHIVEESKVEFTGIRAIQL